jgi:hypothetical protein
LIGAKLRRLPTRRIAQRRPSAGQQLVILELRATRAPAQPCPQRLQHAAAFAAVPWRTDQRHLPIRYQRRKAASGRVLSSRAAPCRRTTDDSWRRTDRTGGRTFAVWLRRIRLRHGAQRASIVVAISSAGLAHDLQRLSPEFSALRVQHRELDPLEQGSGSSRAFRSSRTHVCSRRVWVCGCGRRLLVRRPSEPCQDCCGQVEQRQLAELVTQPEHRRRERPATQVEYTKSCTGNP